MSLLEILVGLTIAGFVGMLTLRGAAGLQKGIQERLLVRQADILHDVIRHEARLAYYRAEPRTMRFYPGTRRIEIVRTSLPVKVITLPSQVSVLSANFGSVQGKNNDLEIRPNGSLSPGSVVLQSRSRQCRVIVALRGALRKEC